MDLSKILIELQSLQDQLWHVIKFHKENPSVTKATFFKQRPEKHLLTLLQHYQAICNAIDDVAFLAEEQKLSQEFKR